MSTTLGRADKHPEIMMMLGRLDGRLHYSPCTDIFLARARLEGAAALATLAGAPIKVCDLQEWISGRTPPPRASEGLNDPVSVAAVFHFALTRDEALPDPVLTATLNALRTLLDDRSEAEIWGSGDLAYFGPMWRTVRQHAEAPFDRRNLLAVAERIFEIAEITSAPGAERSDITSPDGRTLSIAPRGRDRLWVVATALPLMLYRAGITSRVIPSMVLLPKFLPDSPSALVEAMYVALEKVVFPALRDLDSLERRLATTLAGLDATQRSHAPLLARLLLTYPGLRPKSVAQLIGITPQGARKLLNRVSA